MEDSRVEAEAATNALSVLKKTLKGEKKQERKKLETGCLVIRDSACGHDNDDDEYSAKPRVTPHFVLACI